MANNHIYSIMQEQQMDSVAVENTQALIRKDLLLEADEISPAKIKLQQIEEQIAALKGVKSDTERDIKAEQLVENVEILANGKTALVKSQTGTKYYTVNYITNTCDCPDHIHRKVQCKHIRATHLFLSRHVENMGVTFASIY